MGKLRHISIPGNAYHKIVAGNQKPLILAGTAIPADYHLEGSNDGDAVYHAMADAISDCTKRKILGKIPDDMHKNGTTNHAEYVKKALKYLKSGVQLLHINIFIRSAKLELAPHHIDTMQENISQLLGIKKYSVEIKSTRGKNLPSSVRRSGISVTAYLTFSMPSDINS